MKPDTLPLSTLPPHLLRKVISKMPLKGFIKIYRSCKRMNSTIVKQKKPWITVSAKEGKLLYYASPKYPKTVFTYGVDSQGRRQMIVNRQFKQKIEHISFEHIGVAGGMAPGEFRSLVLPELMSTGKGCKQLDICGKLERDELVECLRVVSPYELCIADFHYDPIDSVFEVVPSLSVNVHAFSTKNYREPGVVLSLLRVRKELYLSMKNCVDSCTVQNFLNDWQNGGNIAEATKITFAVGNDPFACEVSAELRSRILEGINEMEEESEVTAADEILPGAIIKRDASPRPARISFQSHEIIVDFDV